MHEQIIKMIIFLITVAANPDMRFNISHDQQPHFLATEAVWSSKSKDSQIRFSNEVDFNHMHVLPQSTQLFANLT